jgi:hypothetical protein
MLDLTEKIHYLSYQYRIHTEYTTIYFNIDFCHFEEQIRKKKLKKDHRKKSTCDLYYLNNKQNYCVTLGTVSFYQCVTHNYEIRLLGWKFIIS